MTTFIHLILNYLAYPMMGKMAYEFGRINEEEYRWIRQHRIPGNFLLYESDLSNAENEDK